MSLQIMQNIYPASWFCLTGHCYVRLIFVKHVICLYIYIRDSSHFLEKIKSIRSIPDNAMLVTADVVGLYPSIPHSPGLNSLRKALEKRLNKQIPTNDLVKMAKLVLSNNYFEVSEKVFQQISGTAIGTKFAPPYACIYMEEVETEFLKTQRLKPLIWLRFIDDIFFVWTHGEENLKNFMEDFNNFKPNLKFTFECDRNSINFLDLNVKLNNRELTASVYKTYRSSSIPPL